MAKEPVLGREANCRKNVARILSLMGFQDNDPERTIQVMRRKLREIQEKNSRKKLSTARKIVFKFGGSRKSAIVHQHPTVAPLQAPQSTPLIAVNYDHKETDSRNVSTPVVLGPRPSRNELPQKMVISKNSNGGSMGKDSRNYKDVCLELRKFLRKMGGSDAKLVIEKKLTTSDVTSNQGRLLIPAVQVKNPDFLTIDEEKKLGENTLDQKTKQEKKESISVSLFDPEERKHTLNLAQWDMNNRKNYVLKTNWNHVVSSNRLKDEMVIRVFSFRIDHQLCFALVK